MRLLINFLFFFFFSVIAYAQAPVIFYSDLTSGPNTGGQNNLGVFVTIWGNNFGATQGTSTVTVGGGMVANYQTWTNNEICFQLGSLAATGNIVVTTSGGTSNGIPFTVRSGNIYFVQPGAITNGNGTYSSPFNHLWYAYNIQVAGDTVYVLAGTIFNEIDGCAGYNSMMCVTTEGTQSNPIAWVAYPNATVILETNGAVVDWIDGIVQSDGENMGYFFRTGGTGGDWQTISKFTMVGNNSSGGADGLSSAISDQADGWRIVGNNITTVQYGYAIVGFYGNYSKILGNEIHDSGTAMPEQDNENHSIYWSGGGTNCEIGWNYLHGNKLAGFEISAYHGGTSEEPTREGTIHDNLIIATSPGDVKGILWGDVESPEPESDVWGQVAYIYNNILVNLGEYENDGALMAVSGTAYIYNNTIYGSGGEVEGVVQFPGGVGPGGGPPVWYMANNIIVNNHSGQLYVSNASNSAPNWSTFAIFTNNNYYGEGNGPTQDPKAINANPEFINPIYGIGGNFELQSISPDIDAGYNTNSVVSNDYNGTTRSITPSIGAYEYSACSATGASCTINSNCCSNLCSNNICSAGSCSGIGSSCSTGSTCCSGICCSSLCATSCGGGSTAIIAQLTGQCSTTGNVRF